MGSNAKSNVVPRKPTKLAGTNAPEYMHGVLAFNRFYPENARGDTFNRHLLVALVIFFSVLDTFLCFHRSVFLLDEYKDDDAIFGNDGRKDRVLSANLNMIFVVI